ncbi:hypothetical protein PFISCL1PPCAC_20309, partial [Pristionchus fissidentatus]
ELESSREEVKEYKNEIEVKDREIMRLEMSKEFRKLGVIRKGHLDDYSKETIRAKFTNISMLTATHRFSEPLKVAGSEWSILIMSCESKSKKYLSAYLELTQPSESLSYTVYLKVSLFSHNRDKPVHFLRWTMHCFSREQKGWGHAQFISFEELLKPSNEYIKNDSIMMAIEFIPFSC